MQRESKCIQLEADVLAVVLFLETLAMWVQNIVDLKDRAYILE